MGNLTHKFGEYYLVRCLTIVSIMALILITVYQLNAILELFKKLIENIEEADSTFEKHAVHNESLARMMFETFQQDAHNLYKKSEPAIIMNIVIYTSVISFSIAGLIAAIGNHTILLIIYGLLLDSIYLCTFLYNARLRSFHCSFIIFVSIVSYLRSYHLWAKKSESNVNLLQAGRGSDTELVKNVV